MTIQLVDTREAESITTEDIFQRLGSMETGISEKEASKRLVQFGNNEIFEQKKSLFDRLIHYFMGPIPFMIETALILSAIVGHWEDFWIIMLMLLMNAGVGFWQEQKADNAIEKLKERLAPEARVLRNGIWKQIPAKFIVPGDIVKIRMGDVVPADLKLIEGDYISVDQSALTGESLPVEKHVNDIAFEGSNVKLGEMKGIVLNTGMKSYFGKTAKMVEEATTESHFQKIIMGIGNYLIALATILGVVILMVGIIHGDSLIETIRFILVLTVAAIPVALPAVLSVTMAIGAIALAKKEAIVSKLSAIEEFAGMDILCSDKTGTITKNKLTVGEIKSYGKFTEYDVCLYATLASRYENKDPIDEAILERAKEVLKSNPYFGRSVEKFVPFNPISKRTEALIKEKKGRSYKVSKGASQVIVGLLEDKTTLVNQVNEDTEIFAERGYRTIGVAKTDATGNWVLVGLISLFDPPRNDSVETIQTAQSMGITVKMITGDHVAIAREVAKNVGLGTKMALPEDFVDKADTEIADYLERVDGFAEVFPEHKLKIISSLQLAGHIVGMTGDGVNDAPALKKADVGIAVEGSTDVAKSAADIVLTRPGLSVIIDAIKQSRKIFQRMTNYSIYRIAETIRVLLFITFSILIFQFYPVTALMIVLLALLNDLPIITIAYDNVQYSNQPERWQAKSVLSIATFLGIIGVISSFGIFMIGDLYFGLSHEILQSFIYLKLSVAGHLTLLVARTRGYFWSVRPATPLITAILATQFVATIITVYGIFLPSMGWWLALFVWGYAFLWFIITDVIKVVYYRRYYKCPSNETSSITYMREK